MANDPTIRVETFTGEAMRPQLPALARLRATVFRDWPYLYQAETDYEDRYLGSYSDCPQAALVLAFAGDQPVGASTCLPLEAETANVQAPFRERGLDPARYFYFAESVLLRTWRGRGVGQEFFRRREAHARAVSNAEIACFCAVERPADHPARPADERTLASFWRWQGYEHRPDLRCTMVWRDVGDAAETPKTLSFWLKTLRR